MLGALALREKEAGFPTAGDTTISRGASVTARVWKTLHTGDRSCQPISFGGAENCTRGQARLLRTARVPRAGPGLWALG